MIVEGFHPAFVLIIGSLLLAVVPSHRLRQIILVTLPILSLFNVLGIKAGTEFAHSQFMGIETIPIHAEKMNLLFVWLFHIAAIIASIYSLHVRDRIQLVTGAMYAGSAIGVAFAGDFLTLFFFWEMLAITSVFQIWAAKTKRSGASGIRYLIFQIGSGLMMLAGIALLYAKPIDGIASMAITQLNLATQPAAWFILIALGIKSAFPFLHTWLTDSYPEATTTGTVFLSAFTTKAAICVLAQTFAGTELLVQIGMVMAIFPIFYAVLENDLRRVLAYSMINQIGFMVVGIGIGSELAINGAVTHAFNDVLFKGLLFMSVGAVLFRTGTTKCSEIGGLFRSMPKTTALCLIGAASISAFPLFSGFVSKSMIILAAAQEHRTGVWLVLIFASAGVLHHAGIKIPFFAFFAKDSGIRCKEAPRHMLIAMLIAAFFCLFNGIFPTQLLYKLAPFTVDFVPYTLEHAVTQLQLLFFAILAFIWLHRADLEPHEIPCVNLDADFFYRKGGRLIYVASDKVLNSMNTKVRAFFVDGLIAKICELAKDAPSRLLAGLMVPLWMIRGKSRAKISELQEDLFQTSQKGTFPIGVTAILAVLLLALLSVVFAFR